MSRVLILADERKGATAEVVEQFETWLQGQVDHVEVVLDREASLADVVADLVCVFGGDGVPPPFGSLESGKNFIDHGQALSRADDGSHCSRSALTRIVDSFEAYRYQGPVRRGTSCPVSRFSRRSCHRT